MNRIIGGFANTTRWSLLALILLAAACLAPASEKGDGSLFRVDSLESLAKAKAEIRGMKAEGPLPEGGVTVELASGVYRLDSTLELGKQDSGTAAAPIVYKAAKGADVWISGGVTVAPEKFKTTTDAAVLKRLPEVARGKVVQVDLAAVGISDYIKELPDKFSGFTRNEPQLTQVFCNGRQMQWARWPNQGFAKFEEIVDPGSGLRDYVARREKRFRPGVFSYSGNRPERWDVKRGVWMMGFWARAYLCSVVRAGEIDTAKKQITWKTDLPFGLDTWGANRWYGLKLLEELDTPGEGYSDRQTGTLYFWAPEPSGRCSVMLTQLKTPLVQATGAEHITFRNIGFEGGRGDAVVISKGRGVQLIGCEIRNMARTAVTINGGFDHKIIGCDIHHVGYSGVEFSGGDRKTLTPANHEVVNCHIHHTNTVKRTHASPIKMRGVGLRLAHNLIHHAPHSAVFYGGNDLTMEYNDIYWCHYETAEGGVFYAGYNWTYRGNRIEHNYIHHINDSLDGSPTGVNVVHLDDCVSGTTFRGNVVYRVGRGVSMCGGPWNVVDNNLFIDCQIGASCSARGLAWWTWTRHPDGTVTGRDKRASHGYSTNNGLLKRLEQVPWNKAPYTKYPHMSELLSVDPIGAPWWCAITNNIAINGPLVRVAKNVKPEWVKVDDNWDSIELGDPGIVAPYGGDYRLKPDAPARQIGFKPIPLEKIGLVNDGTRRSWPVKAEPPPAGFRPAWLLLREMEARLPGELPVVAVRRASAKITVDGTVDPEEWTPGEKQTVSVNPYKPETLRWQAGGDKASRPCKAYMELDDEHLYVAFVNDVSAEGVVGGHTWSKSDAVELALSVVGDEHKPGPIMIWRGYTDGVFETSDEGGAPPKVVEQSREGVKYAAKVLSKTRWSAEFAIPFSAIGIDPKKHNPRMLFNLSVRNVSGDEWVTWKKTPGRTWDVRRGGLLWLEPFGDITLGGGRPSQGNIHLIGKSGKTTTPMKAVSGCTVATWSKPVGTRVTAGTEDLSPDKWVPFRLEFMPESDGRVDLMLMGRGYRRITDNRLMPIWTYYDDVRVEGAELTNGGFEEIGKNGLPAGWRTSRQPIWVRDAKAAASGSACVKAWHDGRFIQQLTVKAGRKVTITCLVRGETAATH